MAPKEEIDEKRGRDLEVTRKRGLISVLLEDNLDSMLDDVFLFVPEDFVVMMADLLNLPLTFGLRFSFSK